MTNVKHEMILSPKFKYSTRLYILHYPILPHTPPSYTIYAPTNPCRDICASEKHSTSEIPVVFENVLSVPIMKTDIFDDIHSRSHTRSHATSTTQTDTIHEQHEH